MTVISLAGGAERDPGGAEEPAAESAGLRRRKDMSTSGCEATGPAPRFFASLRMTEGARGRMGGHAGPPLRFGADFDVQEFDLAVEVAALDLEVVRRLRDVPPVLAQLAPDVLPLERRPRVPQ